MKAQQFSLKQNALLFLIGLPWTLLYLLGTPHAFERARGSSLFYFALLLMVLLGMISGIGATYIAQFVVAGYLYFHFARGGSDEPLLRLIPALLSGAAMGIVITAQVLTLTPIITALVALLGAAAGLVTLVGPQNNKPPEHPL